MRARNLAFTSATAVIAALACTNEVPIGEGQGGSAGSVGGSSGSGTGGSGGAVGGSAGSATGGSGGAVGGSAGVGGSVAVGGSAGAGTGGSVGVGGSAGVGTGGSATGGGPATCPSDESFVTQKIAAPGISDVVVAGALYWSQNQLTNGSIHKLSAPNGASEELASAAKYPAQSAAFEQPDSMAQDGSYLYWRTKEGRSVWRMPLSGASAPSEIATVSGIGFGSFAGLHDVLTVSGDKIYWVQGPNPAGNNANEFVIYSAPKAGGTATALKSYVSDPGNPDKPSQPISLDVDATSVYFGLLGAPGSSKLVKMATDGSSATDLFDIGHYLIELAGDVLMTGSGFVWRIPKAGGTPSLVTQGLDKSIHFDVSQGITEYAGTLYVSTFGTLGTLECCTCGWVYSAQATATNGSIVPLWSGAGRPTSIGVSPGFSGLAFADIDNDQVVVIDLVL